MNINQWWDTTRLSTQRCRTWIVLAQPYPTAAIAQFDPRDTSSWRGNQCQWSLDSNCQSGHTVAMQQNTIKLSLMLDHTWRIYRYMYRHPYCFISVNHNFAITTHLKACVCVWLTYHESCDETCFSYGFIAKEYEFILGSWHNRVWCGCIGVIGSQWNLLIRHITAATR